MMPRGAGSGSARAARAITRERHALGVRAAGGAPILEGRKSAEGGPSVSTTTVEDPRVTVVVASRNRREELLSTLGRHRAPVVLVDNGSTDGTVEAVRREHPQVEVVSLPRNVGAQARSIGVDRATTPFVAFADDDSWWSPGALAHGATVLSTHSGVAL